MRDMDSYGYGLNEDEEPICLVTVIAFPSWAASLHNVRSMFIFFNQISVVCQFLSHLKIQDYVVLGTTVQNWYLLSFRVPSTFGVEYEGSLENLEYYSSIWF